MKKMAFFQCTLLICIMGCTPSPRYTAQRNILGDTKDQKKIAGQDVVKPARGTKIRGIASFYADDFHKKLTANGEIYDMNGLTAAHKTLPFNTWLEVKNLSNGRTVIVRVNDRGPFIEGRFLDLSLGAAKLLDMVETGIQEVEIEVLR